MNRSVAAAAAFPQELVDVIIDHLHDDLPTLKKCSLICKAWEPTSTLHLFSSWSWPPCYHIWGEYAYQRETVPMICSCGHQNEISLARCFELLSSSARICGAVRRLRIWSDEPHPTQSSLAPNSRRVLLQIMELLPSLRVLKCQQLRVMRSAKDVVSRWETGKRSIAELHNNERYKDSLSTASLLALFHTIDKLAVIGMERQGTPVADSRQPKPPRTRVRFVQIKKTGAIDRVAKILEMLQERLDFAVLERLEFVYCHIPDAPSFFRSATQLSTLKYTVHSLAPSHIPPGVPLRSLTIRGASQLEADPDSAAQDWQHILRDVAGLAHARLEELCMVLWVYEKSDWFDDLPPTDEPFELLEGLLMAPDWTPLNHVMRRCPRLRKISFIIGLPQDPYRSELLGQDVARSQEVVWDAARERLEAGPREILDVKFELIPWNVSMDFS